MSRRDELKALEREEICIAIFSIGLICIMIMGLFIIVDRRDRTLLNLESPNHASPSPLKIHPF